jgi:cytidylate kinase
MDLTKLLLEAEKEEGKLLWEGTFADYLKMVVKDPQKATLAHGRIYNAIMAAGVDNKNPDLPRYCLFEGEVFGLERSLERLAQYFASAAQRFEVRKRILLMLGPPASGKSTIAALLKRGLERYTLSDEGAVYAIKGCPMQEEPLHLIPHKMRPQLEKELDSEALRTQLVVSLDSASRITDGQEAELYVTKDDLDGVYDYVPDVHSMAAGAGEQMQQARQQALNFALNPQIMQGLQQQGEQLNMKELLVTVLRDAGERDPEGLFDPIQQPGSEADPAMPGSWSWSNRPRTRTISSPT